MDGKLRITPNEWLIPVGEAAKPLRTRLQKVRTMPLKIQKASMEAVRRDWCWE